MALNLFSITGTLKKNGKLYVHKQLCVREDALIYSKPYVQTNEIQAFKRSIARKIGISKYQLNEYCSRIKSYYSLLDKVTSDS